VCTYIAQKGEQKGLPAKRGKYFRRQQGTVEGGPKKENELRGTGTEKGLLGESLQVLCSMEKKSEQKRQKLTEKRGGEDRDLQRAI